jgi:hypothetical protein
LDTSAELISESDSFLEKSYAPLLSGIRRQSLNN